LIFNALNKNESILIIFKNIKKTIAINYLKVAIHDPATEGLVQQRFHAISRFVVAGRLSFARIIILAESKQLRSSQLA
jgi:hypothetical protein